MLRNNRGLQGRCGEEEEERKELVTETPAASHRCWS